LQAHKKFRFRPIFSPPPRRVVYFWATDSVVWLRGSDSAPQRKRVPGFWQSVEPIPSYAEDVALALYGSLPSQALGQPGALDIEVMAR